MLAALGEPSYRWFFVSMLCWFGAMVTLQLVNGFIVFDLTGSYSALGLISLAQALPMLFFSMVGGVIADRFEKRLIIQAGQVVNGAIAACLTAVIVAGELSYLYLMISAAAQGLVFALLLPARQSLIPELVDDRSLMNAVSLSAAGQNVMRLAAPAAGGVLLALMGAGWVYGAITTLLVLSALFMFPVRLQPDALDRLTRKQAAPGGFKQSVRDLMEGCAYSWREKPIRIVLLTNSVLMVLAMPIQQMLPGFVADVLHEGSSGLGIIMSLLGLGTLGGSLIVVAMSDKNRGILLLANGALVGFGLIAFALSSIFWLSAALIVVLGIGQAGRMSLSNVLLQSYSDSEYRGRVMSVYMTQISLISFGTFFMGILANAFGAQVAFAAAGTLLAAFAVISVFTLKSVRELQ